MLVMQGGDSLFGGLPIIHITYQQYIANPSAYHDPDVIVHISGFPTAGNLPADYVGYDSNLNMEDIGNIATKAIAKVEPSNTALYLHEVGTGFINKDGNYCITDVQISVGGTITLGTNCHVVDGGISSKLSEETIITYQSSPTTETSFNVDLTDYNKICFAVGWIGGNISNCKIIPTSLLPFTTIRIYMNNMPTETPSNYLEIREITQSSIKLLASDANVWFKVISVG